MADLNPDIEAASREQPGVHPPHPGHPVAQQLREEAAAAKEERWRQREEQQ